MVIVLFGPAGAGKSTVGTALATQLGWRFVDADDYHSTENVARMHSGRPLTDSDREPWLEALRAVITSAVERDEPMVVACSALKRDYRRVLAQKSDAVTFVYLRAAPLVLEQRLRKRRSHFAPPALLASQLATLEEPDDGVVIDATASVDEIVATIRRDVNL